MRSAPRRQPSIVLLMLLQLRPPLITSEPPTRSSDGSALPAPTMKLGLDQLSPCRQAKWLNKMMAQARALQAAVVQQPMTAH